MSMTRRMQKFQRCESPQKKHRKEIEAFKSMVLKAKSMISKGESETALDMPDGSTLVDNWESMTKVYEGPIQHWKAAGESNGIYLNYEVSDGSIIVADIFHKVPLDGFDALFICNVSTTNEVATDGSSMIIIDGNDVTGHIVVNCDKCLSISQEAKRFFKRGQGGLYYPELATRYNFQKNHGKAGIRKLISSFPFVGPQFEMTVLAVRIMMEYSEFITETHFMTDWRILCTACHELSHISVARKIMRNLTEQEQEGDEIAAYLNELVYGDNQRSRLGHFMERHYLEGANMGGFATNDELANKIVVSVFNNMIAERPDNPELDELDIILEYLSLGRKEIIDTARRILEKNVRDIFGFEWKEHIDESMFAKLRKEICGK